MREETLNWIVGSLILIAGYAIAFFAAAVLFIGSFSAFTGGFGGHRLVVLVYFALCPAISTVAGYYVASREYHVLLRILAVPLICAGACGLLYAIYLSLLGA